MFPQILYAYINCPSSPTTKNTINNHFYKFFFLITKWPIYPISILLIIFNSNNAGEQITISMSGVISIEGNLGAGKSTLLSFLDVETIKQPVDLWQNVGGVNILQKYYTDPKRWGFTFQLNALHSRTLLWKQSIKKQKHKLLFSQRSPLADRYIFGQIMKKNGNFQPHQYEIYDSICHSLIQHCPIKGIVYLKCEPEICLQRIRIRNRKGEEDIGLEYIRLVHERHQEWIARQKGVRILVIDTGVYDIYSEHHQQFIKSQIQQFVQSLQTNHNHHSQ